MNKRIPLLLVIGCLLAALLCSCGTTAKETPTAASPTASTSQSPSSQSAAVLELVGKDKTVKLTMDDVKKLPSIEGYGGIKSSTGKITPPAKFKGVLLEELCKQVGGIDASTSIGVIAKDGYEMTVSFDQVTKGEFIAYEVSNGDEKKLDEKLRAAIVYEVEGKPLNKENDGDFRLVVLSTKNNQVTDGHWSVKWVTKIQLKPMTKEWTLNLTGVLTSTVDRNTFQSCSAPSCHGATVKDSEGAEWAGVPLYVLVGSVDDQLKHDTLAFNRELADKGYTIDVIGSDGAKATLDSAKIKVSRNYVVAYALNGSPLPEKYFPLRLMGLELSEKDKIGKVSEIKVNVNK